MPPRRRSALLANLIVEAPGSTQLVILDELRRVILDGAVPPTTPIPVGDVAELFGVSHIPVRESLKTLIGEGLVDHRHHSGYAVAQLTPDELYEMYLVRETLEIATLPTAVGLATGAEQASMVAVNDLLEAAVRANDPIAFHRQSRAFHLALTRPSRMYRLLRMLESAWNITEPIQPMVHVAGADRAELHSDHRLMLAAFLDRDAERLVRAAQRHHHRLNDVIATLPKHTGLLAEKDI